MLHILNQLSVLFSFFADLYGSFRRWALQVKPLFELNSLNCSTGFTQGLKQYCEANIRPVVTQLKISHPAL